MRLSRLTPVLCSVACLGLAASASAATLRVCASGCEYTALQPAIDAASQGDTILLRAGETFVGPFILRVKPDSNAWITIRSDASDSLLPGEGVRLVPSGKPDANTSRSLLPRLLGQGGTLKSTPVVRTAAGAHHYILKFLEIDGSANLGFETLIALGDDTAGSPAHDLVVDRVYAHGHPYKGIKRGIALNGVRTDVLNSYISDIKAVNADSQALAGHNGAGPFRIINNYLEAAGENVLFGGSDPAISYLVPSNIEVRQNHLYKPLTWQGDILPRPGSPKVTSTSGAGNVNPGVHYFKVVALMDTDTRTAVSAPSDEISTTVPGGVGVTFTWSAVPGADRYRVYRGAVPGAQSVYLETSSAVTTFTYSGASEKSGAPAATGTKWTVKNILELKSAEHVMIQGNILENVWHAGQYGYAIVLTPRNQYGSAPWTRLRDITITNNIVRHASGVLQLAGYDVNSTTEQTRDVTVRNNLFYDIDPDKWGGSAKVFLIGDAPANVVIDHNTIIHANSSVVYGYGSQINGFAYTNNISKHGTYGIMGQNGRAGQYSIDMYFPGSDITYNVLAGGSASAYPAPNAFPTLDQWNASFANLAADDYRLLTTSVFHAAAQGGGVPGADIGTITAWVSGPAVTPPAPPPAVNVAPVARPGGPYSAVKSAARTVDGSASSDADGSIVAYRWTWGDEVVVDAADLPASGLVGSRWTRVQVAGASGGVALHNPNRNDAKLAAPAAVPASYVEARFYAAARVPYHLWFRMRAEGDAYTNDSMFVQFSGSVDSKGNAINRIGSSNAAVASLEEGTAAGVSGWGWNDDGYGTLASPVYFATSGLQTVRVQQREDGIMWDQLVLSSSAYLTKRPGLTRVDTTIIADPDGSGMVSSHAYAAAGLYPLILTVLDNAGAAAAAATTVSVGDTAPTATLTARAGGPYAGLTSQSVTFDGSASTVPSGTTAQYGWTFGDDVVLDASSLRTVGTRWASVADTTASTGRVMENADRSDPKITTAQASPSSYIEATFLAAAGVPYRLWIRMRAASDSYSNDSLYAQFSGTVSASGAATTRIGSLSALAIVLEDGSGAGLQAWGWADAGYGTLAAPIYFNQDATQTIRILQREDGVRIDQIVISANAHRDDAPGAAKADATTVSVFGAGSSVAVAGHAYQAPGSYPVSLTVVTGSAGIATDTTVAVIK